MEHLVARVIKLNAKLCYWVTISIILWTMLCIIVCWKKVYQIQFHKVKTINFRTKNESTLLFYETNPFECRKSGTEMECYANLRWLHRSEKNHRKIIVIGQIIGSKKIDSFRSIESIIKSIQYPNFQNESITMTKILTTVVVSKSQSLLKHIYVTTR